MLSLRPAFMAEGQGEREREKDRALLFGVLRVSLKASLHLPDGPGWMRSRPSCTCMCVCVVASSSMSMDVVDFGANKQFE